MPRKITYLIVVWYCCVVGIPYASGSQNQAIDSLQQVLLHQDEDTSKITTYNLLAQKFIDAGLFNDAQAAADHALELAAKLNYRKRKGDSYNKIGLIHFNQGNYSLAREYFLKAFAEDRGNLDYAGMSRRLGNIGLTYDLEYDFATAMTYHTRALRMAKLIHDPYAIAGSLNAIGLIRIKQVKQEEGLTYFYDAMKINANPVDKNILFTSFRGIAACYTLKSDFLKALTYYYKALRVSQELQNKPKILYSTSSIAYMYSAQGSNAKALEYLFKALQMAEEMNNKTEGSNLLSIIGNTYYNQGDMDKAMIYFLKSYKMMEESGDKARKASVIGNLGSIYRHNGNFDKAQEYFERAIKLNSELNSKSNVIIWLNYMGELYGERILKEKNKETIQRYTEKQLHYYQEAWKYGEEVGNKTDMLKSSLLLGDFFMNQHQEATAERYLKKALDLSEETGEITFRKSIHKSFAALYKSQHNIPRELDHYKKHILYRDSVENKENVKKSVRTEINFEFEKKRSIDKLEQEKKDIRIAAETRRQKTISWFIGIVAIIILCVSGLLYRNYLQKQKINTELHIKNQRIEIAHQIIQTKNNEITDSINYALHIQKAMLPDKKEIERSLPQSFILYKPKDIVSGDFYYFSIYHDKIFIATADCTGHGVPGGFMSMIGTEKLNNAIKQDSDPGHILALLNKGVKQSLQHSENDRKLPDGMDIGLCSIDVKNGKVEFAGANRPLWIIRKNTSQLEEIRGTIASIGGYTEDDSLFKTHHVQLEKGDTIYLSTDGYGDQFGIGDKKLTTKRFKTMLESICDKSLMEQDKILANFLSDWMKETEQTDDILVIGIRI